MGEETRKDRSKAHTHFLKVSVIFVEILGCHVRRIVILCLFKRNVSFEVSMIEKDSMEGLELDIKYV